MLIDPVLFLLVIVAVYAVASRPVFVGADLPPSPRAARLASLDGLRGILAVAVVVHHCAFFRSLAAGGDPLVIGHRFLFRIGPAAVAVFFMITGFLFWSILLRERGRPAWFAVYAGRVLRIGPVYLVAVGCFFAAVALESDWTLRVPRGLLIHEVGSWLLLGMRLPVDLNGDHETWRLLGIAWSLHFEWMFYASLPIVALAARHPRLHLPIVLVGLVGAAVLAGGHPMGPTYPSLAMAALLFLLGMTVASLHERALVPRIPPALGSCLALVLTAAALARPEPYAAWPSIFLGLAFFLVTAGADMFGLLRTRVARRVGDVSYGIYLMHLLVLQGILQDGLARRLFVQSDLAFWTLTACVGVVTFAIGTALHVTVEKPGISLGRRLVHTRTTADRAFLPVSSSPSRTATS